MGQAGGGRVGGGNPVLRFFGLHTGAAAADTVLWGAPYLGVFLAGLILLSLLVQRFLPLPLWTHLLALGLAGINCFFFLAHIRQTILHQAAADGDDAPETSTDEG